MDWVSDTIAAFGESVGIPDLELDSEGYLAFTMDSEEVLCVQDLLVVNGDFVLVSMTKALPMPQAASIRKAMRAADFRANSLWQMQLALQDAELMATLRIPRPSFVISTFQEAIEALFDFHARLADT